MNNTKKLLLIAIVTATLVLGTSVIPMQSYASEEHKENSDLKSSIKSGTDVDKNGASQHSGQATLHTGAVTPASQTKDSR